MPLPSLYDLTIEAPLYYTHDLEDADADLLIELRRGNFQIDCSCLQCERETVHKTTRATGGGSRRPIPPEDWMFRNGTVLVSLVCVRCDAIIEVIFNITDRSLVKWGQLPSIADLAGAEMRGFRKVLSKPDYDELNKAIGLNSHGVGIGSFVYLRRIFERLVSKYAEKSNEAGTLPDDFDALRMNQKVSALRDVLPQPVYEYREAYAILSMGIHELSEQACKAAFPVILASVRMMLEEEIRLKERTKAAEELKINFHALKKSLK